MIIILLVLLIWKIAWYIFYLISTSNRGRNYAPMTWKMVKDIYNVNPDKWSYSVGNWIYHDMRVLWYKDTPILLSFFGYQMLRFYFYLDCLGVRSRRHKLALENVLMEVEADIARKRSEK